jgi:plastocyanin
MRRGLRIALVAAAALGFVTWSGARSISSGGGELKPVHSAEAKAEVKIDNFTFGPATVTVDKGSTVIWINRDDIPHTVVSSDKVFKSKVLDTDEQFSFTFAQAGTYPYFCSIHPKMTGTVVVK